MGRGKSKARQKKVARDLKYSIKDTDLELLAEELHSVSDQRRQISGDTQKDKFNNPNRE